MIILEEEDRTEELANIEIHSRKEAWCLSYQLLLNGLL